MANYLIIGGTSGIGLATAKKLLALGHAVFITGRDPAKTEKTASDLNAPYSILDASDFNAVDSVFESAKNKLGVMNGVVNCAGSLLLKSAHLTNQDEYVKVITANLTTAFAVVRAAGKHMTQEGGSVVLLSSAAALTGISKHEAIAAAKAGIVGLIKSAAATYAPSDLRFNGVAPGLIETPMTAALTANEKSRNISLALHALGRLGQPDDVASAVIFFLLPENSWITGQMLAVDGGLSTI
jgi:NAD(P)-dependent dehydrogenase (short-subunit alcohol dehydrogenase family)